MEQYSEILKQQATLHAPGILKKYGLICKQLPFGDGPPPLYMAKPQWTNRFDEERQATIGIFCSIWVAPTPLKQKQFAYNIHSKNIRNLPGHKLVSKKFANDFRDLVRDQVSHWPNISLEHGPITLLQGKDTCELDSFAEKVEERINGFVDIHQHIDSLLDASAV